LLFGVMLGVFLAFIMNTVHNKKAVEIQK